MAWRCETALVLLLLPSAALGQFHQNGLNPYQRRAMREQAVAWAGPDARGFVETGDEAALALLACSPSGARKLVEFHYSGMLDKLPHPPDLLRVIAMHGDAVLLFAIQHAEELTDPNAFTAFMRSPAEYALALKSLDQGTAEVKAANLTYYAAVQPKPWDAKTIALWSGIAGIVALFIWRRRRYRASGGLSV